MKIWRLLKNRIMKHPKQIICEGKKSITYEQIVNFSESFSKSLSGIKCCAILCQSEMSACKALLSCFAANVTALPLSKRYGELHCNKILDFISPDAIITDKDGELQVVKIINYNYKTPKSKPALIMCTSGTTGLPKGVMLTENNIITNVLDICDYFDIGIEDTILISRPLYHCAVLTGEFLTALVKGSKICFYSGGFNPTIILNLLKSYNATAFCGTPTLLNIMQKFIRNTEKLELRYICISGECMGREVALQIASAFRTAKIYHIYGLTEACPRVSYLPPKLFKEYPDCVGIPLKSVSIKIFTKDGKSVQKNEVGILWVKGKNVMAGYYNNPRKTSEVLKNGWLCTGDCALINEEGLLKIMGRHDDLIIKAGMNIYPQEIENAIRSDVRVKDVYVHDEYDEKKGTQIVLNIVGDFSSVSDVKKLCQDCLPAYQVPNRINLLNEIPKNGSGKIIRR